MKKSLSVFIAGALLMIALPARSQVVFDVDPNAKIEPMRPLWAWVGYDEPNYTYMKDGAKLLTELSESSMVPVNVRAHNLLTSGDGSASFKWGSTNAYTEDANGNPVYYWDIVDRIFDTYLERGMKPFVEIGFMPEDLAVNAQPYRHGYGDPNNRTPLFSGWTHQPKDYSKWGELVYQWVLHCIDRYGKEEVLTWYWEVWNEPDIGYWKGTQEEYCKLYDYAAEGFKRALPDGKIGGPETTDPSNPGANEYLRKFLEHCRSGVNYATGKIGSPLDFVTFHAKGSPKFVDGHVRMGIANQLRNIDAGCTVVASFPEYKNLPIIIGESDPEGCAACSVEDNPQNAYRNGTMYSSYSANTWARTYELSRKHGVNIVGAVAWAFEFEGTKWFAGYRDLATNGVDEPIVNIFRMYGMMSGDLVTVKSNKPVSADDIIANAVHDDPDISAIASADDKSIAVMIWNYHDDELPSAPADIALNISGIAPEKVLVSHYRVDVNHSNSYEVWKAMGSPQDPTPEQYKTIEEAGHLMLYTSPKWTQVKDGKIHLDFPLPRQGVSLVKLTW